MFNMFADHVGFDKELNTCTWHYKRSQKINYDINVFLWQYQEISLL